jgi:hypothetical protein
MIAGFQVSRHFALQAKAMFDSLRSKVSFSYRFDTEYIRNLLKLNTLSKPKFSIKKHFRGIITSHTKFNLRVVYD